MSCVIRHDLTKCLPASLLSNTLLFKNTRFKETNRGGYYIIFFRFSPDLFNSSVLPSLKASLDLSAEYLILTDVQRKVSTMLSAVWFKDIIQRLRPSVCYIFLSCVFILSQMFSKIFNPRKEIYNLEVTSSKVTVPFMSPVNDLSPLRMRQCCGCLQEAVIN